MSSTNTPVTHAAVRALVPRLEHVIDDDDQVWDLLRRLLAERDELRERAEKAEANQKHLRRCLLRIEELAEGTADPTGYEAEEIQPAAEAIYGLRRAVAAAVKGQRRRTVFAIVVGLLGAAIGANVAWGLA